MTTQQSLTNDEIEIKNEIIDMLNTTFGDVDEHYIIKLVRSITVRELEVGKHIGEDK